MKSALEWFRALPWERVSLDDATLFGVNFAHPFVLGLLLLLPAFSWWRKRSSASLPKKTSNSAASITEKTLWKTSSLKR